MPSKPHRQAAGSAAKGKFTLKNPASNPTPLPNWPPLHPLVPTEDLSMEVLLKDQIIIIRNLFTATLCKNYVSFLSSLPLTTTPAKPKEGDALRVNDRFEIHDPAFAEQLWSSTALKHLVTGAIRNDDEEEAADDLPKNLEQLWGGESCGLNPRIRIYRYRKGQFFGQHCMFFLKVYKHSIITYGSLFHINLPSSLPPSFSQPTPTFASILLL